MVGIDERPCPSKAGQSVYHKNMLHMPQFVLEFGVVAKLYAVQTFNFKLGHV